MIFVGGCSFLDSNEVYVTNIVRTETIGDVSTYTIYYSDGTTSMLRVNDGQDGENGENLTIESIKDYIAAKGFNYEGNLIENFYLSLKSKPFVILAGTSGTGKTRLVKLFAEAIGAKMKLVPVRPDWSDSSDLFGHTDLSGKFQPGAIIDFIKQAEWDKETPYFMTNDNWYYYDEIEKKYKLTLEAPKDAIKDYVSKNCLFIPMHLRKE
jgi:hypothetical protein